jgi:NTE family protein
MRPIDFLELRPSRDLGRLAQQYEDEIPSSVRFLTTGLGTHETESPDWLSVLLFEPAFIDRLLDIGYHDARREHDQIARFLADETSEDGSSRDPWTSLRDSTVETDENTNNGMRVADEKSSE